jgi:flavin-binding protein dodecin
MAETKIYKVEEIVGTSDDGVTEAIDAAIHRARKTLRNLDWFEVQSIRGHLEGDDVAHYQVTLKVGFRLEE